MRSLTDRRVVLTVALLVGVGFGLGGCPQPNHAPVANAGADATVGIGSAVVLNGAGSTDADGDSLTFQWTQSSGTAVTLNGATTSSASFTAPNAAATLVFQLTVNDGNGGTNSDSVTITVQGSGGNNNNPTANAGADQAVAGGAPVTLTGSGADIDGDPLTFAWTQTAGAAVTLAGAATNTATFSAPQASGTLTFQLTVNDGRGGSGTDTVNVVVTATPVLFITNFTGNSVTSYEDPASVNGNIAPHTNLSGAQTQLSNPSDIVIDRNGALLASNFNAGALSVTAYDNASAANGNLTPNRNVSGAATGITSPTTLAINNANDLVFVANIGAGAHISVYSGASTVAFNGNLPPIRTITSAELTSPFGINFDANDNLYVANNGTNAVLVYAGASALNGAVSPARILTSAAFAGLFDVYVDNQDRLYVVKSAGQVLTFNNASSRNGVVSPDFTLTVTGAVSLTAIAVDDSNTGYIVDNPASRVYAFDNIATRNGALTPDRTIAGANTQLAGPIRVFLQKR